MVVMNESRIKEVRKEMLRRMSEVTISFDLDDVIHRLEEGVGEVEEKRREYNEYLERCERVSKEALETRFTI